MTQDLTYASYLKVPELLALQQRLSDPPHHDEMLFIIVHQVHELWFKQILHEVDAAIVALDREQVLEVSRSLLRVHSIQRVILAQIGVLETMTPQEFNSFRSHLNPASGFQSVQFREIEAVSGLKMPEYLAAMKGDLDGARRLERRLGERTLYDALLRLVSRRGFSIAAEVLAREPATQHTSHASVVEAFRQIYENPAPNYAIYNLLEEFVEYDENFMNWRSIHVRMVERMIGMRRGTGGSAGVPYLATTLGRRFFPELWEVRTLLGGGPGGY